MSGLETFCTNHIKKDGFSMLLCKANPNRQVVCPYTASEIYDEKGQFKLSHHSGSLKITPCYDFSITNEQKAAIIERMKY